VALEAFIHRFIVSRRGGRLIDDNDVQSFEFCRVVSKGFSNDSLNTVSCCCLATVLFGDGKTEPGMLFKAVAAEHCKEFVAAACGFLEHPPESGRVK
jgi:hypothetical protein